MSNIPDWARPWKRKETVLVMVGALCYIYMYLLFRYRHGGRPLQNDSITDEVGVL